MQTNDLKELSPLEKVTLPTAVMLGRMDKLGGSEEVGPIKRPFLTANREGQREILSLLLGVRSEKVRPFGRSFAADSSKGRRKILPLTPGIR